MAPPGYQKTSPHSWVPKKCIKQIIRVPNCSNRCTLQDGTFVLKRDSSGQCLRELTRFLRDTRKLTQDLFLAHWAAEKGSDSSSSGWCRPWAFQGKAGAEPSKKGSESPGWPGAGSSNLQFPSGRAPPPALRNCCSFSVRSNLTTCSNNSNDCQPRAYYTPGPVLTTF